MNYSRAMLAINLVAVVVAVAILWGALKGACWVIG